MAAPRMRPRFEAVVPRAPSNLLAEIHRRLSAPDCPYSGTIAGHHALLHMRRELQHTWSPYLDLAVEQHARGALLRGRFGPHPSLWTFFVALYAICAFVGLAAAIMGFAQWSLSFPPTALWGIPVTVALALVVYAIALIGQGLAQEQMHLLRAFLNELATA